jgi:hypothetical protein
VDVVAFMYFEVRCFARTPLSFGFFGRDTNEAFQICFVIVFLCIQLERTPMAATALSRSLSAAAPRGACSSPLLTTLRAPARSLRLQPHRYRHVPSIRRFASHTSPHLSKPPRQGQPLHATHPHLVGPNDLTPGITANEYHERRKKLMASLPDGSVVVCMGGTVRLVSQRELFLSLDNIESFSLYPHFRIRRADELMCDRNLVGSSTYH